jgi:membrane-associated protein
MHTVKILTLLVDHHQILAYAVIFLGLIFEGEFVVIAAGIFAHLGALDFSFALIFILLGGISKTFLGYYVGGIIHNKWHNTKILKHVEKKVFNIMPRFKKKPFWSIFTSKFIMGLNNAVIIYSGYMKVDYRKYLKAEFFSTVIWAPLLLSLGFFFGYTALNVSREIWRFSLVAILLIISFIFVDKFIGWIYEIFEEFYSEEN